MITSNSNDEKKGLIIGFLWGIAFFFKQTAIFDIFSMLIYILFFNIKNINKKKFLNFSFYGFLCCFFIAMIYPFYNDSLKETFEAIFFKNIRNYTNLKIDFFSPLIFITSLFIKLFLKVQDYFNIMIQSLIPLTIFILPLILGSFKTFINFKDLKPAHKKILFFSIIWFITDIFGISLIGRNFSHYYIQLAPPFILVIISFISELSRALNKILFIIIFIVILINSISLFRLRIKDDNFLYPKKVKKSVEIAKYIKTHTPESSTMFIFKDYNIDIFFLSNRLSCNAIYMYVDMDSAHTKNKLAESYYRSKFLENLPQTLLTGPLGNILNSTSEPFFDAIIRKNYTLKKEMYGTKIYFLKSPTSFIE